MDSKEQSGLDYFEPLILKNTNGFIEKRRIGEFVDSYLSEKEKSNDNISKKISGMKINSFNSKTFLYEISKITGLSKKKAELIYELQLDDNSRINLAENTICYRFDDCCFKEVQVKEMKIGDYLPLSNILPPLQKYKTQINLLEYNPNRKVNIKDLITAYPIKIEHIKQFLRLDRNSDWKYDNIMLETKERGLSVNKMQELLSLLKLNLKDVNQYIRIITKGNDKLNPIIPICSDLLFFSGMYIAEGHTTKSRIIISNSNENIQNKCQKLAHKYEINFKRINQNDVDYYSVLLSNFFEKLGKTAYSKKITNLFYNVNLESKAILLSAIFDGDGWVERSSIDYLSASLELIYDIKNLLLYFGIITRVRSKIVKYRNSKEELKLKCYHILTISGKENLEKFLKTISFSLPYKIQALRNSISTKPNTNVDIIPNCASYIKSLRIKYNLSQKDISSHLNCTRSYISLLENNKRFPSKNIFRKIIDFDENKKNLTNLLKFNFRRIVSIQEKKPSSPHIYSLHFDKKQNFSAGYGNIFVRTI